MKVDARRAAAAVAAAFGLLGLAGCGADDDSSAETATPAGLAAAVYPHLDPAPVRGSGSSNEEERWVAVSLEVPTDAGRTPLDVFVYRHEPEDVEDPCAETGEWILSCEQGAAADGSPSFTITSTEDLTGGRSEEGFFVFSGNVRDEETVLVIESLETREPSYLDLSGLPVDRAVLEEIASDPSVGMRVSAAQNAAGRELVGFDG